MLLLLGAALTLSKASPYEIPFANLFDVIAFTMGVPRRLMIAIVAHESGFNPRAVNLETAADKRKGRNVDSIGLAQILWPDTAKALSPNVQREDLFDPYVNLSLQALLLRELLLRFPSKLFDGFPADAVAAYNAGSPRKVSGSSEYVNQGYVNAVHAQWRKYNGF